MKNLAKFAVRVLGIAAVMISIFTSCTDQKSQYEETRMMRTPPVQSQDPERYYTSDWTMDCSVNESEFTHKGISTLNIFVKGKEEAETSFKKSSDSNGSISALSDTLRVDESNAVGSNAVQTSVSIDRGFKGNSENDNVLIAVSDGQTLELTYSAEHANAERWMGVDYNHAHDSLLSARLLKVEDAVDFNKVNRAPAKYVKIIKVRTYYVVVTTQAFDAEGNKMGSADEDTLVANAIVKVLADNNTTNTKTGYGEKVINETQQQDSVIITKTWSDGHSEPLPFRVVLNRWLKNIERREVIVPSFNNAEYATSFAKVEGGESLVRQQDANWAIYGREVVISKMVSVNGHVEEVRYTYYQERADFNYEGVSHSFDYVDWTVENYADDFKSEPISSKSGYDQLSYKNEIKTNYLGFIQMYSEAIAWFKEAVTVTFGVINASRHDYTTYTLVSLEKVAYYSDNSEPKVVGKYEAQLPISVKSLTKWTLTEDAFGVYTSGDLATTLASKSAQTEKSFSYNQYVYNFSNEVKGQLNKGQVSYPNDIVFNDGDVEYKFANSDLNVSKKNEGTSFVGEDDQKTTYSYACVAGVTFGDASQEVTLPGTINITKPEVTHEHGKVVATYMTSTPSENRSYWYNVAVIQFEDGYRMVGMANNDAMSFEFTMSSTKNVNSAVYANGVWMPAKASDEANCMKWKDENGVKKAVLDYVSATAMAWNNGHNTVNDVRREGKISEDGYSVTFYLNGNAGQTLNF